MGYLNLDIKEGSFDDIGASGTLDGMCEDYEPSWTLTHGLQEQEINVEEVWRYGAEACDYKE